MGNAMYRVQASELLKLNALARSGDMPKSGGSYYMGDFKPRNPERTALRLTWSRQGLLFIRGDKRVRVHGDFDGEDGGTDIAMLTASKLPKWVATFDKGTVFDVFVSDEKVEFKHDRSTFTCPTIKDAIHEKSMFGDIPDSAFASGVEVDDVDALRKVLQAHVKFNGRGCKPREIPMLLNVCLHKHGKDGLLATCSSRDNIMASRAVIPGRVFGNGADKRDFLVPSKEVFDILDKSKASGRVRLSFTDDGNVRVEADGIADTVAATCHYVDYPNVSKVFQGFNALATVDVQALRKLSTFALKKSKDKFVSVSFVPRYGVIAITERGGGELSRFDFAADVQCDDVVSVIAWGCVLERLVRVLPTSGKVNLSFAKGDFGAICVTVDDMSIVFMLCRGELHVPEEWPHDGEQAPEVAGTKRVARKKPVAKAKPVAEVAAKPVARRKPKAEAKPEPEVVVEKVAVRKPKRKPVAKPEPEPKREPEATTQVIPEVPPKVNAEAHVVKVSESVIPALVVFRELPGMGDVPRRDVRKVRDSRGRKVAYVVRTAGSVQILWRDWYTHDDVSLDATVRALAESWAKAA